MNTPTSNDDGSMKTAYSTNRLDYSVATTSAATTATNTTAMASTSPSDAIDGDSSFRTTDEFINSLACDQPVKHHHLRRKKISSYSRSAYKPYSSKTSMACSGTRLRKRLANEPTFPKDDSTVELISFLGKPKGNIFSCMFYS